ncbi:hypothetical protein AC1031_013211 [Aphanomyces cochlioides]|nr:hypothetical protein AC1031_013211 [Aphanomyces cochlioides]
MVRGDPKEWAPPPPVEAKPRSGPSDHMYLTLLYAPAVVEQVLQVDSLDAVVDSLIILTEPLKTDCWIQSIRTDVAHRARGFLRGLATTCGFALGQFVDDVMLSLLDTTQRHVQKICQASDECLAVLTSPSRYDLNKLIGTFGTVRGDDVRLLIMSQLELIVKSWCQADLDPHVEGIQNLLAKALLDKSEPVRVKARDILSLLHEMRKETFHDVTRTTTCQKVSLEDTTSQIAAPPVLQTSSSQTMTTGPVAVEDITTHSTALITPEVTKPLDQAISDEEIMAEPQQAVESIAREEKWGDEPLRPEENNEKNDEKDLSGHFPLPSDQMVALSNLMTAFDVPEDVVASLPPPSSCTIKATDLVMPEESKENTSDCIVAKARSPKLSLVAPVTEHVRRQVKTANQTIRRAIFPTIKVDDDYNQLAMHETKYGQHIINVATLQGKLDSEITSGKKENDLLKEQPSQISADLIKLDNLDSDQEKRGLGQDTGFDVETQNTIVSPPCTKCQELQLFHSADCAAPCDLDVQADQIVSLQTENESLDPVALVSQTDNWEHEKVVAKFQQAKHRWDVHQMAPEDQLCHLYERQHMMERELRRSIGDKRACEFQMESLQLIVRTWMQGKSRGLTDQLHQMETQLVVLQHSNEGQRRYIDMLPHAITQVTIPEVHDSILWCSGKRNFELRQWRNCSLRRPGSSSRDTTSNSSMRTKGDAEPLPSNQDSRAPISPQEIKSTARRGKNTRALEKKQQDELFLHEK